MDNKTCRDISASCGCCDGVEVVTPLPLDNRPGLDALRYRIGTHTAFLESMEARLASMEVSVTSMDGQTTKTFLPLQDLHTRESDDPAIALLDAWATLGDVLTFYQERIANEAYLRTATERRSILELARLVGYALRPGVASTVYLAYTLDNNQTDPVEIPVGARTQSVPGPGELPQSFETSEKLEARLDWNNLPVRLTRPQKIDTSNADILETLYIAGTTANLKKGDRLLLWLGTSYNSVAPFISSVENDFDNDRTRLDLVVTDKTTSAATITDPSRFVDSLLLPHVLQARGSANLSRSLGRTFVKGADVHPQLLVNFAPKLKQDFYQAWSGANVNATPAVLQGVYVARTICSLFGANAQLKPTCGPTATEDCGLLTQDQWAEWELDGEQTNVLWLDGSYDAIVPDSYVIVTFLHSNGNVDKVIAKVDAVDTLSRSAYGINAKSTRLTLHDNWWSGNDMTMATLRSALVYAQTESLPLAEEPLPDEISEPTIPLAGLYKELTSGRWVILSGERTDIPGVTGVTASELMMISGLKHDYDPNLPGDKTHTTLLLATSLAYRYKRESLKIYGNVVKATNGETRNETLGNGDGAQSLQAFTLKQPPLTFVPAANPKGVSSTLKIYVNDVEWHETDSLAGLGPQAHAFVTKTDDDDKTSVLFGNGEQGARLPTGVGNVKGVYRNGIGKPGNVLAGQISLLMTRPLGVKEVINPLRASGGVDKENRDQARANVPLEVMALDRLVSIQDYADFARNFAGIAKAAARRISDGRRELLYMTIAGADDVPIDTTSDLYINLLAALREFGDPGLPVRVDLRELKVLLLSAKVRLLPDYQWDPVVTTIRATLLDVFGFQRRALGQPVLLDEVIAVIQNVRGVEYVDVDSFGGIPEKLLDDTDPAHPRRRLLTLDEMARTVREIINANYTKLLLQTEDLLDSPLSLIVALYVCSPVSKCPEPYCDLLTEYLFRHLTPETQALFRILKCTYMVPYTAALAANPNAYQGFCACGVAPELLKRFLVADLNKILEGENIYNFLDDHDFSIQGSDYYDLYLQLSAETIALAATNPQGDALVQLNRWLLEDVYPEGVAHSDRNTRLAMPTLPNAKVETNPAGFEKGTLRPAQLTIFSDSVPDTLILNQIK